MSFSWAKKKISEVTKEDLDAADKFAEELKNKLGCDCNVKISGKLVDGVLPEVDIGIECNYSPKEDKLYG